MAHQIQSPRCSNISNILRAGLLIVASTTIGLGAFGGLANAATVATDLPDYSPGQTVIITGSGAGPL